MKNYKFILWLGLGFLIFSASCVTTMSTATKGFNYTFPKDQHGNQVIAKNSYCKLVDGSGNTIIPGGKYIYIKPLNDDKSCGKVLYKAETRRGIDLYDGAGKLIAGGGTTDFNGCDEGLIKVRKGDFGGVIDQEGKEIIPAQYDYVSITEDGLFTVTKSKKKGIVNADNEVVVPFVYDKIKVLGKDSIYVYTGDRDSIARGSRESYELDAFFNGQLTKNVEKPSVYTPPDEDEDETLKKPFTIVQIMPRFPGCEGNEGTEKEKKLCAEKKMLEYIYRNIKYPTLARIHGVEGMVVVSFVVEKDGSITRAKILRDVKGGCGDESLRIVNTMPKWTPGRQRDKPVRVQFNLPVRFKLSG